MNALPGFELRAGDDESQRGDLLDGSGHPRARLDGTVLEAVYGLSDGYLVVSSDGDAFEECLHLTLCDQSFAPQEVIHLGGPYQTGTFRAQAVGPGPLLRFSFFSDESWQLEVSAKPRWRLRLPRPSVRHWPAFQPGRLQLLRA